MKVANKYTRMQSSKKSNENICCGNEIEINIQQIKNQLPNHLSSYSTQCNKNQRNYQIGKLNRDGEKEVRRRKVPIEFRSSARTDNNGVEQLRKYQYKWEVSSQENQMLKQKIKCLTLQNMELRESNRQIKANMEELLRQLTEYRTLTSGTLLATTDIFTPLVVPPLPDQKKPSSKPTSPQISNHLVSNLTTQSTNYKHKCQLLKKLNENLTNQNKFLIQYKTACLNNITILKQKLQKYATELQIQKQFSIRLEVKSQEQGRTHVQDQKYIEYLERRLKIIDEELNDVAVQKKMKQKQWSMSHEKFHKDLSRMKEKCQKYKNKGIVYRNQRDQLAMEIEKAKIQIGAVTLRKYLKDESNGS